jgi:hypothetical protein
MALMMPARPRMTNGPGSNMAPKPLDRRVDPRSAINRRVNGSATAGVLRQPVPGRLYPWVKRASYFELALFSGLLIVWAIPGLEEATFLFGLAHGVGYISLVIFIWIAAVRHEVPYWLLAATLTPVGPVGSVIGIAYLDRRRNQEGRDREGGHAARPTAKRPPSLMA